jgi:hypothetical protein
VIEIHLAQLMNLTLKEIKRLNPNLDTEELKV